MVRLNNKSFSIGRQKKKNVFYEDSLPLKLGIGCIGILVVLSISVWFHQIIQILFSDSQIDNVKSNEPEFERVSAPKSALTTALRNKKDVARIDAPQLPLLPAFAPIPNAEKLVDDLLKGENPSIPGIVALSQIFLTKLHEMQSEMRKDKPFDHLKIVTAFYDLVSEHLIPFEEAYRGRPIFDIREDDSVFISIAAFREHLLDQTMRFAFDNAENPDKLYIGAVVQNCFGLNGGPLPCKTGAQVVGKNKQGRDKTKVSDAPPDTNGIETFCGDEAYKKYCDSGQIRVIYIDENEALGPAYSRYFASKLWGGETHFMQVDSHLVFAKNWDTGFINEAKAAKSFPKAVLSSYPPGFSGNGADHILGKTSGSRLCSCEFSTHDVEKEILRINAGGNYHGDEDRPKQIPFIAAGFFFARAEFLVDVPFDPFLPWCFMGEEILLSIRAWTSGWDIYAPRLNLIAHQYRPGRMGLPKFWGSVGRTWGGSGPYMNSQLQWKVIHRIKNLVGYEESTREKIGNQGLDVVLRELEHYGPGSKRTLEDYLELAKIDVQKKKCHYMEWCTMSKLD